MGRDADLNAESDACRAEQDVPAAGELSQGEQSRDDSRREESGQTERSFTEPSPLEVRYRRLLLVLPTGYRAVRAQEMMDTFLARECGDDPENADLTLRLGWPGAREASSVLALAVRVRWAGVDAAERVRVRASAIRIAVLATLTVFAVLSACSLLAQIWSAATNPEYGGLGFPGVGSVDDLWVTVPRWSFLLWIVALLAVLSGRPRWAQLAGAVPLLAWLVGSWWWAGFDPMSVRLWAVLIVQVAVLVGLTGFENRVPVLGWRAWILASVAGILAISTVTVAVSVMPAVASQVGWVDEAGFWCAATVIAAAVLLVRRIRKATVSTEALLGVAGLAGAALILRVGTLTDFVRFLPSYEGYITPILVAGTIQLVAATVVLAVTGTLGVKRFRQLPPVRYNIATPRTIA